MIMMMMMMRRIGSKVMRESKFETVKPQEEPREEGGGGEKEKKSQKTNSRIELENSRILRLSSFWVGTLSDFIGSDHGVNHWSNRPVSIYTNLNWKLVYKPLKYRRFHPL